MANGECTHRRVGKEPCVACGGKRESNTKDPSTLDKADGIQTEEAKRDEEDQKRFGPGWDPAPPPAEKWPGVKKHDRAFSAGWSVIKKDNIVKLAPLIAGAARVGLGVAKSPAVQAKVGNAIGNKIGNNKKQPQEPNQMEG